MDDEIIRHRAALIESAAHVVVQRVGVAICVSGAASWLIVKAFDLDPESALYFGCGLSLSMSLLVGMWTAFNAR